MLCIEDLDPFRGLLKILMAQISSAATGITAARSQGLNLIELSELARRPQLHP
jgi:hypothetical protein